MINGYATFSWGYNHYGQIGDGTNIRKYSPMKITALSNIDEIASGIGLTYSSGGNSYYRSHCLAKRGTQTFWAWGYNGQGQHGDGSTSTKNSPALMSIPW